MNTLMSSLDVRHGGLVDLLDRAAARDRANLDPGAARAHTDRFLVATSRHASASVRVLLPTARRTLRPGSVDVRAFVRECRRLERALVRAKAKQYGQAQSVQEPWASVWERVRTQLTTVLALERALVARLGEHLDADAGSHLSGRFDSVVSKSPSRPHPNLPHTGATGWVARGVWGRFDALWDELEGRVTGPLAVPVAPEPAH